ncbi:MAG: protein O-mannosyl-transferase family [Hyphomicrobiales bacterium]
MSRTALGAAWVAALTALWVYVRTLSPTVAWVNMGEDSGDLLSASATLGIAHPTGYPLFVLLGRVASLLPVGATAFRINLIAALAGAASVFFLARLVLELTRSRDGDAAPSDGAGPLVAALAAAAAYAFSRGAWSQSVLAEVYSLNAAFFGAVLWACARADRARSPRHLALAAFLLGLGLTNHLLLLAAGPAVLVTAWRLRATRSIGGAMLVLLPLLLLWGISLDLYLPIRAWRSPEFSWGVPATPKQLWWVLSGAQYERHFFARGWPEVVHHLLPGRWILDFGWGLLVLALGWAALAWRRPGGLAAPGAAFLTSLALLSAYSIPDDVGYWMPVLFLACALAGVGWAALWRAVPRRAIRGTVAVATLGVGALGVAANFHAVDASQDVRPWVWAHRNLEAVEPNALIVSEYDGRTFALWFYKATDFARTRPGLVVIYKYLLVWPWYQHHLARVYPTLAMPPYPGDMDAMMNRLIARNIKRRPVYLIRKDPALLPIFTLSPVGYAPDPIYRVGLKDESSVPGNP